MPIFQMRKLRHREVKLIVKGHRDLSQAPEPALLTISLNSLSWTL